MVQKSRVQTQEKAVPFPKEECSRIDGDFAKVHKDDGGESMEDVEKCRRRRMRERRRRRRRRRPHPPMSMTQGEGRVVDTVSWADAC